MREINLSQSESKRRLLDAAESLFAERGFEAVSVRDITHLAKANVAAINYHFGTREGLVGLVVTHYLAPVIEERLARLDALERKGPGKAVPVEEILDALVRPLVGIVRKSGMTERLTCKLLGRISELPGEVLPQAMEEPMRHWNDRFTRALAKSLPAVAPEELVWRAHFVVGAMIHMLMNQEMLPRLAGAAVGAPTLESTLSRFIRFAAAGLREGVELEPVAKKGPQATFNF